MTRVSRERSENGYYHIMIRGNNRNAVFEKDREKEKLIEIIEHTKKDGHWKLRAYCVMDNHAHFIIQEDEKLVTLIMKKINVSYAMYYNKRHQTVGHVFQDRFKSDAIKDDRHLLAVMRYIHKNPLHAGMVKKLEEYKWSSYNEYISKSEMEITDTAEILKMFFIHKQEAIKEFIEFHKEDDEQIFLEDNSETKEFDEKTARDLIEKSLSEHNGSISAERKNELVLLLLQKTKLSQRKIAEMVKVDRGVVQRIGSQRK